GSGGLTVAQQIYDRFKAAGTPLNVGDITIVDGANHHYYQVTLVGAGLRNKSDFQQPMEGLVPKHINFVRENVVAFSPTTSSVRTASGRNLTYDALVVATGLKIKWDAIQGLQDALANPGSGVSSIYSYDACDKAWHDIENLRSGQAIFTQPAGVIKCAGAPQKIMWMAYDRFKRTNRLDKIQVNFCTGMPTMFSVKKYSDALDDLRIQRGINGWEPIENNYAIQWDQRVVSLKTLFSSSMFTKDLMHVLKRNLLQCHWAVRTLTKRSYATTLPDNHASRIVVVGAAPVLTENLHCFLQNGKVGEAKYDGYSSCPLLTGYGKLMLAEFQYGFVPKETFSTFFNQAKSNRLFYYLKKDFFPFAYWNYMVKGKWFGRSGWSRPAL
ncbi:hypothetical protein M378DRAFT_68827, partial [Amanita muscaria Koide BX008]